MGTYTFLEAVEKLSDGKCGKIAPKKNLDYIIVLMNTGI